ncbi:MAG: NADH-quinone oxidoreductase subunit C [Ardenticatenia bacterium]|uniref:NADH-quinone oxidoreductase subunit C n=1 Tax=Ardenticatena maritima TaxID=872965 RepID=A0A0M8K5M2_9CHLR|nr:NADH-quinone oxidoreductase subunit C [Ardenticatena maritima]KPL89710.1 hypothetical protein SE16_04775 [Ardenticatena maritima]RME10967.1 MAG: NADH-quinone oxidoreductase subunit C [Ardenticatenia bacterium]GAP62223.1 NADH-quinone oxidoreductase subunit C [Ardenticatena maritima]
MDRTDIETTKEPTTADLVREAFGDAVLDVTERLGETTITLTVKALPDVARWLRDERGFEMCVDVTATDHPQEKERFRVVYHLLSLSRRERLRLAVRVGGKKPTVPTLTTVWPGVNFCEREVYDMFGVHFDGHPNLKRILMPEDWDGHPLRKDYPLGYEPVQFTHNFEEIDQKKPYAKS